MKVKGALDQISDIKKGIFLKLKNMSRKQH
jgi:hypothetical protein